MRHKLTAEDSQFPESSRAAGRNGQIELTMEALKCDIAWGCKQGAVWLGRVGGDRVSGVCSA